MEITTSAFLHHHATRGSLRASSPSNSAMKQSCSRPGMGSRKRRLSKTRAVMARPQEVVPPSPASREILAAPPSARETVAVPPPVRETAPATVYHDNWVDKLAIGYLSRNLQEASGTYALRHIHLVWIDRSFFV
jgi:beta-carotene isomerase